MIEIKQIKLYEHQDKLDLWAGSWKCGKFQFYRVSKKWKYMRLTFYSAWVTFLIVGYTIAILERSQTNTNCCRVVCREWYSPPGRRQQTTPTKIKFQVSCDLAQHTIHYTHCSLTKYLLALNEIYKIFQLCIDYPSVIISFLTPPPHWALMWHLTSEGSLSLFNAGLKRRCRTSTLIMVPINVWRNSDPFEKKEHVKFLRGSF